MLGHQADSPKHSQVYAALRRQIQSGQLRPGDRLPSEADLVRQFGASRITVGRAVRDLQAAGLVDRRAGAGTFVKATQRQGSLSFGLLIPDLGETEIFEPICQGMMASPLARNHALVWGSAQAEDGSREARAWKLCQQYIDRRVAGVFFAALELAPAAGDVNQRIVQALDTAKIPVVLLDRPVVAYPRRTPHDLVGIDNRRAGFIVTEHLAHLRCKRIAFMAAPNAAATVDAREAGYREALFAANLPIDRALMLRTDAGSIDTIAALMKTGKPDGIVCANDRSAARLMQSLTALGFSIPRDVRIVGIDDVDYAALLPVRLTTLRQPTRQIGDAALSAMLQRIERPDLPPREILLPCELIVRASCGAIRAR